MRKWTEVTVGPSWDGDAAYEQLLREHGGRLERFAFLLTGSQFDAEDIVQDAVIAVAARWRRMPKDRPYAYLRKAVARKAIDLLRSRKHDSVAELPERSVAESGYLLFEDDVDFVRHLRVLPPRQRAVLILRYQQDLDDHAIGRVLGCTASTVRSQAARALATLRTRMGAEE